MEEGINRGDFLILAGSGLGFTLSGGLASLLASPARAAGLPGGGEFPVGLWWPPPPEYTNEGRYREVREAGFNFAIGGNGVASDSTTATALRAAEGRRVDFIVQDMRLRRLIQEASSTMSTASVEPSDAGSGGVPALMQYMMDEEYTEEQDPELRSTAEAQTSDTTVSDVEERVRKLVELHGTSSAFAGLNLYDEPHASYFGTIRRAKEETVRLSPGLLPYVNLPPSHTATAALGTSSYETYLSRYMERVVPPVLSFDHYPLLERGITRDYFLNWSQVRRHALANRRPLWVFVQSIGFDGSAVGLSRRRTPKEPELLWQVNVALAYGAEGVQYFTYWTPERREGATVKFGEGMVSRSGERTPRYYYAKRINPYLKRVGGVLRALVSESVQHARESPLPAGANGFRSGTLITSASGSPVILGLFRRPGSREASRHLLVVNRSYSSSAKTSLGMARKVSGVRRFVPRTGQFVAAKLESGHVLKLGLPPGGASLFRLNVL